jgi:hypothetical protein
MGYAPKALWVYLIVVALVACTARVQADGKFFGVVAAEGNGDPTIPAQRAVIAWDPPYQTLAIDTAFVGVGDRFAWLVPLPSEPEIRPATRGMFDSVAALTAPRITPASQTLPGQMLAVMLIITVIIGLLARSRSRDIVIVVLLCLLLPVVLVPAMGKSKRSVSDPFPAVEVLNRASAGVYDTATLSAEHADELIAWLNAEGFATPEGVRSVVQQYLDRGWVFAAAKVRADTTAGEHQPHPLCFRFQSESALATAISDWTCSCLPMGPRAQACWNSVVRFRPHPASSSPRTAIGSRPGMARIAFASRTRAWRRWRAGCRI